MVVECSSGNVFVMRLRMLINGFSKGWECGGRWHNRCLLYLVLFKTNGIFRTSAYPYTDQPKTAKYTELML
ncbi:hypothetical protein HMPREF6745_0892 [Prevotella sp. oral taxon 472 str. F0295]|nr:hypothetical protein HMPREF6745_0892 [Prevotella sp. oral taxon 472 str. F0295]